MAQTIQAVMATKIALDTMEASQKLSGLKRSVNAVMNATKAAEANFRNAGDAEKAAAVAAEGLKSAYDRQQEYVDALSKKQENLIATLKNKDEAEKQARSTIAAERAEISKLNQALESEAQVNGKSTNAYKELSSKLDDANAKMKAAHNSLRDLNKAGRQELTTANQLGNAQAKLARLGKAYQDAQNRQAYFTSGLGNLQRQYRENSELSSSYVSKLEAENNKAQATSAKYRSLKSNLQNLYEQQRLQREMLAQVAESAGKTSEAYRRQAIQLNNTGSKIASTSQQMSSLEKTVSRVNPTGITKLDSAIAKVNDTSSKLRGHLSGAFDKVKTAAIASTPAVAGFGAALYHGAEQASNLDNQYRQTQNLLITGGEKSAEAIRNVSRMQRDGKEYSIQYGQSQADIAAGYQELTKRGYSSSQSLGAMKTMLQAAAASGEPLSDVITSSAGSMEAFGLRADGTAKMLQNTKMAVNQMTSAADLSATNFNSMSVAMQYAGPQAHQLGYSVGETASAIGILSNNGLEADKAGTGLRETFNSLISPTAAAQDALKGIGLSTKDFVDQSGKMKPIASIMDLINQHTQNLNGQQKGALFKAIFGATGESAAMILSENTSQLSKLNSQVQKSGEGQGYVARLAQKNMGSAKMSMQRLKQTANAAAVTVGKALLPSLNEAAKGMTKAFDSKKGQRSLQQLGKAVGNFANQLVKAFESKKTQSDLKNLMKLISALSKQIMRFVTFLVKNHNQVAAFVKTIVALKVITSAVSGYMRGYLLISRFATALKAGSAAAKIFGGALKVIKFGGVIGGVAATIGLFVALYKHNAKFRNFCNGIAKSVTRFLGSAFNWIKNNWKQIGLFIVNPFAWSISELYKHNSSFRNWVNSLARVVANGFNVVKNFATNVVKSVGNFFTQGIPNAIKGAFNALRNAAKEAMHYLLTPVNSALKSFENVWNKLADKMHLGKITASLPGFASGTTSLAQGQMAVVNDAEGEHWREAMAYQGRIIPFPKKRNMVTYLPAGAEVINGDDAHDAGITRYASGSTQLSSIITQSNANGAAIRSVQFKKFLQSLKDEYNKQMQKFQTEITKLMQKLQQAFDKMNQSIAKAQTAYNNAKSKADTKETNALNSATSKMETAKDNNSYNSAVNQYNQALQDHTNSIQEAANTYNDAYNQATSDYNSTYKDIMGQKEIAEENERRLGWWYNNNLQQYQAELPKFADGGITAGKSIAGEAGPEMIIPLDPTREGRAWNLLQSTFNFLAGGRASAESSPQQSDSAEIVNAIKLLTAQLSEIGQAVTSRQDAQRNVSKNITGYDSSNAFNDFSKNFDLLKNGSIVY
ncbi:phage tail tape measure protein [Limosilactobacillus antri]|uniref:phage tail tape measure protein n=1 Tax=Limosilactobacillus antri TaxID=227943 RepID=UPI001F56CB09|nr:phage tail tape measure protein [Limosilactobacillus antri]